MLPVIAMFAPIPLGLIMALIIIGLCSIIILYVFTRNTMIAMIMWSVIGFFLGFMIGIFVLVAVGMLTMGPIGLAIMGVIR